MTGIGGSIDAVLKLPKPRSYVTVIAQYSRKIVDRDALCCLLAISFFLPQAKIVTDHFPIALELQ